MLWQFLSTNYIFFYGRNKYYPKLSYMLIEVILQKPSKMYLYCFYFPVFADLLHVFSNLSRDLNFIEHTRIAGWKM